MIFPIVHWDVQIGDLGERLAGQVSGELGVVHQGGEPLVRVGLVQVNLKIEHFKTSYDYHHANNNGLVYESWENSIPILWNPPLTNLLKGLYFYFIHIEQQSNDE